MEIKSLFNVLMNTATDTTLYSSSEPATSSQASHNPPVDTLKLEDQPPGSQEDQVVAEPEFLEEKN